MGRFDTPTFLSFFLIFLWVMTHLFIFSLSTAFLSFNIILVILNVLPLHINFVTNLSIFTKQRAGIMTRIALILQIKLERTDTLITLSRLIHQLETSFHFIQFSFDFVHQSFIIFSYISCTYVVRFIPKYYFILGDVNGAVFFNFNSTCLMLVYRKK